MSARRDGMPQGHPEKQPDKLATLTLYVIDGGEGGPADVQGELRIHVSVPPAQAEAATAAVTHAMRQILGSPTVSTFTECVCGQCDTTGGGGRS